MTRVSATNDGRVTDAMTRYYERFAHGGFGLVVTEGIYTDQAYSQGYQNQPGMSDDQQAASWKPLVSGLQRHGAMAVAQIMHAGAISQFNRFREIAGGPSAIKPKGRQMTFYYGKDTYAVPRAMTDEEIADAVSGFGSAAARAVKLAGFDGLEIHGANGYLLDQFLTDYTNARTDQWGGDTKERVKVILAVLKEVREKVGTTIPVGVRISQGKVNDFSHKWPGGEQDAELIFGSLSDNCADFVHVTEFEAWKPAFAEKGPSLARLARKYAPRSSVIANGGLHDIEKAKEMLNHEADLIAFGRGALANPSLPKRVAEGLDLNDFDPSILGPIANIKKEELAML